jgi:hypothetical protein
VPDAGREDDRDDDRQRAPLTDRSATANGGIERAFGRGASWLTGLKPRYFFGPGKPAGDGAYQNPMDDRSTSYRAGGVQASTRSELRLTAVPPHHPAGCGRRDAVLMAHGHLDAVSEPSADRVIQCSPRKAVVDPQVFPPPLEVEIEVTGQGRYQSSHSGWALTRPDPARADVGNAVPHR